jgi:hypothetical protein
MKPGAARQGSVGRNHALLAAHGLLIQRGIRKIPFDAIGVDPFVFEAQPAFNFDTHQEGSRVVTTQ